MPRSPARQLASAVSVTLTAILGGCAASSYPSSAEPLAGAVLSALRGHAPIDAYVCDPTLAGTLTTVAAGWTLPVDERVDRVEPVGAGRYIVWFDHFSVTVAPRHPSTLATPADTTEHGTTADTVEGDDDLCVVALGT